MSAAALALAGIAASALLLWLSRDFTFRGDEWAFILGRRGNDLQAYLAPHNEHPVALPVAVYKILLGTVGLRSYMPYMIVLVALHLSVVGLVFALMRRRVGDAAALAGAVILLFLGSASENLLWAFQISFLASTAFGLLAFLMLEDARVGPVRVVIAALSVIAAVGSSLVGVIFVFALSCELLLDHKRRRYVLIPAIAFGAVFLLLSGSPESLSSNRRTAFDLTALAQLPSYVAFGLGSAVRGVLGLTPTYGPAALVASIVVLSLSWVAGLRMQARGIAMLLALIFQFASTGLVRAQIGEAQAGAPRYVYAAAVCILLLVTDLRGYSAPLSLRMRPIIALIFVGALLGNSAQLVIAANAENQRSDMFRTALQVLETVRESPGLDLDAKPDPNPAMVNVQVRSYLDAIRAYGSPYASFGRPELSAKPAEVRAAVDRELFVLFRKSLRLWETRTTPPTASFQLLGVVDLLATALPNGCQRLTRRGPTASFTVLAPGTSSILFQQQQSGRVQVSLAAAGDFQSAVRFEQDVAASRMYALPLPDLSGLSDWRARFDLGALPQEVTICVHLPAVGPGSPDAARVVIDVPAEGTRVSGIVPLQGWAIDRSAVGWTGVTTVDVHLDGPPPIGALIGRATYGANRPDVAQAFGADSFTPSGWALPWNTNGLRPGEHTLYVSAVSRLSGRIALVTRTVRIDPP